MLGGLFGWVNEEMVVLDEMSGEYMYFWCVVELGGVELLYVCYVE